MNLATIPWLELSIVIPLIGAPLVGRLRDKHSASRWCLWFTSLTLVCTLVAWLNVELGYTTSGPETAAPTMPASEIRLLPLTRVMSAGISRGTVAARATPYALEQTRQPSTAGYISSEPEATGSFRSSRLSHGKDVSALGKSRCRRFARST